MLVVQRARVAVLLLQEMTLGSESSPLQQLQRKAPLCLWSQKLNLSPPFLSCPTPSQHKRCLLRALLCTTTVLHKPPPVEITNVSELFSHFMNKHTHSHLPEITHCPWHPSLLSCNRVSWMEVFLEMTNHGFVFSSKNFHPE